MSAYLQYLRGQCQRSYSAQQEMSITTERADDNESVATEHAEFDLNTDAIIVGTYRMHWTQANDLQLGTLRALQVEMAHRTWVPITMEELQAELENIRNDTTPSKKCKKSFSGILEAISRCVAAFQKAGLVTEESEIKQKIIDYAMVILSRIPPWREPLEYAHCIHVFIRNRAQNLALKSITDELFTPNTQRLYCVLRYNREDSQQHDAVITFLEHLHEIIQNEYVGLRSQIIH